MAGRMFTLRYINGSVYPHTALPLFPNPEENTPGLFILPGAGAKEAGKRHMAYKGTDHEEDHQWISPAWFSILFLPLR